jgi:hypothetical protein
MKKYLTIGYGALTATVPVQLKQQGFKFNTQKANHFEKLRDSITYLAFNDILTDSEIKRVQKKLNLKIKAHIIKENKL